MVALKRKKKQDEVKQAKETRKMMITAGLFGFVAFTAIAAVGYVLIAGSLRENTTQEGIHALDYSAFKQAKTLLSEAGAKGEVVACDFLAWLNISSGYYEEAYKAAALAVRLGSVNSYEILGDLALLDVGPAKGTAAALSYFKQGAFKIADLQAESLENGDSDILPNSASSEDFSVAALTHKHDVNHDGVLSQEEKLNLTRNLLGNMIRRALPLIDDENAYTSVLLEADRNGVEFVDLMLGDMIFLGNDMVTSNAQRAVEYWNRAIEKGNTAAITRLAGAHWHGYAVKRDPRAAVDLYKSAAGSRDPIAMYALALINIRMASDPAQAAAAPALINNALGMLAQASALGYGPASTALAVFSVTESSEAYSVKKAVEWLKIAAVEQNDIAGRIIFDLFQLTGTGMPMDFAAGFDDLVKLSENYKVPDVLLVLMQRREDPAVILRQVLIMAAKVLKGEYAYKEGDPVAAQEIIDPDTDEPLPRPFPYYTSVDQMSEGLRTLYGRNNYPSVNGEDFTIDGVPLLAPEIAQIIVQYNPSTGADRFVKDRMMPRPLPPAVPEHYSISDFVPPVELITPAPLYEEDGTYRRLF